MLNRVPEVTDAEDAIVWGEDTATSGALQREENGSNGVMNSARSGEVVFENVSFHYKQNSRKRALGASLVVPFRGGGRRGG
eukprot:CAMPEP_0171308844 /NCGR_PEP_ID=MMETSP0816-20121228/18967_1 /TAXON_ID=420281 /ORGANISM="Proboscia inermis, Strain CCAP1064/1" /LENGTH=80 /DNA_ID=CAMNT_0011792001 /DNA_START=12 /DNA_END=250 /DNA_ORIENTATION=-